MKLQFKFNFFIFSLFFIFLNDCVLSLEPYQYIDIGDFEKSHDIHQKWLQYNSIPESARLLKYPPYLYHTSEFTLDALNLSSIISDYESLMWDNFTDSNEIDAKCSDDLIQVFANLNSQWALQMLDSNGKVSNGILRGGLIWPGFYKECLNVYAPLDENGHGNFHGQYCVSSWSIHLSGYKNLPLTVGLCTPDSCSGENIKTAIKNSSHILDHFPVMKQLTNYLTLNSIICKPKEEPMDAPSIIYLTIVSVFIICTILGSSIAVYDDWKEKFNACKTNFLNARSQNYGTLEASDNSVNKDTNTDMDYSLPEHQQQYTKTKEVLEDEPDFNPSILELQGALSRVQPPAPVIKRIFLCFSIFTNGQKILNTDSAEGQLPSIHGIRFLSLVWVIIGHTYVTSVSIIGNKLDVIKEMDSFAIQMLLQAPFSVDSFFLLSGFLLTYLFLKDATKKNGKINWLLFYFHRLYRLTPSYLVVVFFYMLIFKRLGSGPFWNDKNCDADRSSWWQYILYLNNFIPIRDMCLGWSWYLANDMQFYVISPLFLYPLYKWPTAGFTILGSILIATWTTTGIISYKFDLIPMFVGVTQTKDFTAYQDRMWNSFDLIYDKPYCRIAPYIVGVILGYVIFKTGGKRNFLNWWQQLLGWILSFGCSFSVVFGLYHVEMSRTVSLFYNSLCRTTFAIGVAWVIYACETGHGGFVTKLLSWKLWIPLSRLTYCAYLVHPMLIHGYYQSYKTALHFTEFLMVTNFMGFLLMSYMMAFAFSLVFESPFMNLEKLLLKKKG